MQKSLPNAAHPIETAADKLLVRQIRDYCKVGVDLFWQRQMTYVAAIGLAALYYDPWLALTMVALIAFSEAYDYLLFRQVLVWKGRSQRAARHFLVRTYIGTAISALVISFFAIGIAIEQGPTTHFMSLFFLFAAALFAAMNNHHLVKVLMLRLAIYGVSFIFIPVYDIIITGATLESELWMQLFTVLFVLFFIIDCSRIFLGMYRRNVQQLEELKVEHEKTKVAFKAKSDFLSTISHELRTPMTSIKGSIDMTCAGMMGELPEKAQKTLLIAQRNSVRLTNLINEILDLQKFEAGKIKLDIAPHDLRKMLRDAVEMNAAYADQFNVSLKLGHLHSDIRVDVDEKRFQQIMANILSNAAKFSKSGDTVLVRTEITQRYARVLIVDQGIGLQDKDRATVFEEFSQVDSTDQRAVGGTGLGMNISKRIVEAMGGSIDFRPNEKRGTTFFVDLPLGDMDALDAPNSKVVEMPVSRVLRKFRSKFLDVA